MKHIYGIVISEVYDIILDGAFHDCEYMVFLLENIKKYDYEDVISYRVNHWRLQSSRFMENLQALVPMLVCLSSLFKRTKKQKDKFSRYWVAGQYWFDLFRYMTGSRMFLLVPWLLGNCEKLTDLGKKPFDYLKGGMGLLKGNRGFYCSMIYPKIQITNGVLIKKEINELYIHKDYYGNRVILGKSCSHVKKDIDRLHSIRSIFVKDYYIKLDDECFECSQACAFLNGVEHIVRIRIIGLEIRTEVLAVL